LLNFRILDKSYMESHVDVFLQLVKGWEYCTWERNNFLYDLPRKWDFSFAGFQDESLSSFCIASNKISDAYYIHLFFVSPESRGRRTGREMIAHAERIALQHGIKRIELRCPEKNAGALAFYRKEGFVEQSLLQDEVSGPEADYYLIKQL
jgi:ribosomal protein S18 acetylase RimI-like enzyme